MCLSSDKGFIKLVVPNLNIPKLLTRFIPLFKYLFIAPLVAGAALAIAVPLNVLENFAAFNGPILSANLKAVLGRTC